MKKWLTATVLAVLIIVSATNAALYLKLQSDIATLKAQISMSPDMIDKLDSATVKIETTDKQNAASSGSGSIIRSDGYILTAYHVVNSPASIKVTLTSKAVLTLFPWLMMKSVT
jgi:S1-C subfamily serine protease